VTTALHSGHVVETLLEEARNVDADLVVMATHGRGTLSRAWLGSVADAFMHGAEMPVLFARPEEGATPTPEPVAGLETILVPLDGTELSESALAHATELGELFGCSYHLTRVVSYPIDIASPYLPHTVQMNQSVLSDAKADAAGYLEDHADGMRTRGLRVTTSVLVDAQVGQGILDEAEAVGCDLIAMATHARTGVGRLVLGSAADKVLRGTHVPLLLYRPSKKGS
jgi:nucleotide-binding universal stress UspA family protein